MNTLFILGNGFDLNLGLKTSYQDFYEYYENQPSSNVNIEKLKKEINNSLIGDSDNWSDLELALGNYSKNFKDGEELENVLDDVIENLGLYLEIVENSFSTLNFDKDKLFSDLKKPELYLSERNQETVKKKLVDLVHRENGYSNNHIEICTFNYTKTIDDTVLTHAHIGQTSDGMIHFLSGINHIHGFVDERTVLGVNDESQIKNEDIRLDSDALSAFVKPICNMNGDTNIIQKFKDSIKDAHIIYCFGLSFGDTDYYWWELLQDHLKDDGLIIIFDYTPISKDDSRRLKQRPHKKIKYENEVKNKLLRHFGLDSSGYIYDEEFYSERILVGLNTEMFKIVDSK